MEYLNDYCAITEHRPGQFHKTRLSIWSFINQNGWFNGRIIILVLSESDLKKEEITQLKQIHQRIEVIEIDSHTAGIIKKKTNKKFLGYNHTLDFSFLYAFRIKSKGNLYFSSSVIFNREVTSFLNERSATFCRKSGKLPSGSGSEVNPAVFYIPGHLSSVELFDRALLLFQNHNNIFGPDSKSQIITESINSLKIPINLLGLTNLVDASQFPENRYREFLRYNKSIRAINMNTIDHDDNRFARINLFWQQLNKRSRQFKPSRSNVQRRMPSSLNINKNIRKFKDGDFYSKFCIMITTYNRPLGINRLTEELKKLDPKCRIVVVDDASDTDVDLNNIDEYIKLPKNNGKKGWWKTVNTLWNVAISKNHEYYIMMPDDALPTESFFSEAERLWNSISDPVKIALHLANNNRERNWTNFSRIRYSDEIFLTQTTEFSFICKRDFISYIIPEIPLNTWKKNPLLGSGVGPRLNRYWVKRGRKIYGVKKSLVKINLDCQESIMNPKERKKNPWIIK